MNVATINTSEGAHSLPSEFKDPFTKDSVDWVTYHFHKTKSMFRDGKFHHAVVRLQSGSTTGKQEFYDDDPNTLRLRVENYINNLK